MPSYLYPLLYGDTNLQEIFKYLTSSFEVLFVLEREKPGARLSANEKLLPGIRSFCKKQGLIMDTSDFKVVNSITKDKQFANLGVRIRKDSSIQADVFVYLSPSMEWVHTAKQADADNSHALFGRLLGYPDCCISFFEQHAPQEMAKENDYILPAVKNSRQFFFENNIVPRYVDLGVLSHFPCSFGCQASRKLAQEYLSAVARHSPGLAGYVSSAMRMPVVITDHDGAHILQKARQEGGRLVFDAVQSTTPNALHVQLAAKKAIDLNNPQLLLFS
ncbi:hypothetical protein HYU19_04170 [Candidatus Woesearchaeota archaeon]|nr:hypothetical protein [Candidatus Woesearchaeota archaeon]